MSTIKLSKVYNRALYTLLQPFQLSRCTLCLTPTGREVAICEACEADLPYLGHACQRCAIDLIESNSNICGHCLSNPPPQNYTRSFFLYDAPISQLISQLKFEQRMSYGRMMGQLFAEHLFHYYKDDPDTLPQAIVTVPLSRKRLAERGFNQTNVIARPVAKRLQLPLYTNLCRRNRDTAKQLSLPAKDRPKNLRNAFELHKPLLINEGNIKHIAIMDDVMTTGATLESLAKTLKKSGVETITFWPLARTPRYV